MPAWCWADPFQQVRRRAGGWEDEAGCVLGELGLDRQPWPAGATGVYFYRLHTPGFRDVKKAVVVR
jgi:hypothetical protein